MLGHLSFGVEDLTLTFEEAWASKITITVGGLTFHVIGREALIRNKRATGRDKDLLDVRALEGA